LIGGSRKLIQEGKLVEAQRLHQRTMFDLEMIKEMGFCRGIEKLFATSHWEEAWRTATDLARLSATRHDHGYRRIAPVDSANAGHVRRRQARKRTLVEYGFRLPSALDNRPLNFREFETRIGQTIYVSATPGPYELTKVAGEVVEQIIRPTGLMDRKLKCGPSRAKSIICWKRFAGAPNARSACW